MTNIQFQSMNELTQSDDYTITLARKYIGEKIIISLLRIETWIHFLQGLFVTLFEIDQWSVYINVIYHYLPLEKGMTLNKIELPQPDWLKWAQWLIEYRHCTVAISLLSPKLNRVLPFSLTYLSPRHPRMLCVRFVGNWPSLVTSLSFYWPCVLKSWCDIFQGTC